MTKKIKINMSWVGDQYLLAWRLKLDSGWCFTASEAWSRDLITPISENRAQPLSTASLASSSLLTP